MVEEHLLRLLGPAHIAVAEVVERGVGIPGHKDTGQAGSLVIPAVFRGKFIGTVIGELVAQRGILLPPGPPDCIQLHGRQQAGSSPVKPQRFLPVSVPILRSQHMGSDTLRLTRAYPLKLTQAGLCQAQGADDPTPVSLHAPFLQVSLLHQPCNQAAIIVIVPRQLPHQRHRHLSTQAHKLHQLHCHTSILQLHLNILHTHSHSSTSNRLTAANMKHYSQGCRHFMPATLTCPAPFHQAA